MFKQVLLVLSVGVVLATLFSAWTSRELVANTLVGKLGSTAVPVVGVPPDNDLPTPTPRPRPRLGIVAGHWGSDSGAVCPDGLTEADVNLVIATLVKEKLVAEGFDVDLLKEFDIRLTGYRALALVSIHADSCEYLNDQATGFKVAAALSTTNPEKAERLAACLRSRYGSITGLDYHAGSITVDMTSYHAFDEINHETTAVIIETGFLNLDRQLLEQNPEIAAQGITAGILCYIYNEDVSPIETSTP